MIYMGNPFSIIIGVESAWIIVIGYSKVMIIAWVYNFINKIIIYI